MSPLSFAFVNGLITIVVYLIRLFVVLFFYWIRRSGRIKRWINVRISRFRAIEIDRSNEMESQLTARSSC